jgi:hypothetical protein
MRRRRGVNILEMLTAMAGLVIVLGLMASLANYVRARSADTLTRQLLGRLQAILAEYHGPEYDSLQAALRSVPPLIGSEQDARNEATLRGRAQRNSTEFVRIFRQKTRPAVFQGLPAALYDQAMLRDAWGTPVAYFHPGAANIDIAPQQRAFFLSAGPDRKFTTTRDNLYGYDERPWER